MADFDPAAAAAARAELAAAEAEVSRAGDQLYKAKYRLDAARDAMKAAQDACEHRLMLAMDGSQPRLTPLPGTKDVLREWRCVHCALRVEEGGQTVRGKFVSLSEMGGRK